MNDNGREWDKKIHGFELLKNRWYNHPSEDPTISDLVQKELDKGKEAIINEKLEDLTTANVHLTSLVKIEYIQKEFFAIFDNTVLDDIKNPSHKEISKSIKEDFKRAQQTLKNGDLEEIKKFFLEELDKTSSHQESSGNINLIDIEQTSPGKIEWYHKEFISVKDVVFQESYCPAIELQIERELTAVQDIIEGENLEDIRNFFSKEFKTTLIYTIFNFKRLKASFLALDRLKGFDYDHINDKINHLEAELKKIISHGDKELRKNYGISIVSPQEESEDDLNKKVEYNLNVARFIQKYIADLTKKALILLDRITMEIKYNNVYSTGGILPCK